MIRAYLARSDTRLQRADTWCWAHRVPVPRPAGVVQSHGAPATLAPSRTADRKDFS
jgi:hypothetical protein